MKQNNKWNELTMQQKADLMRLYVANGYTNLDSIRKHYNTFNEGGPAETQPEEKSGWKKAKEVAYDVLEFVDPTGISSWATSEGDFNQAIKAYKNDETSLGNVILEGLGALPVVGKLGKAFKLAKYTNKVNKVIKATDKATRTAKKIDTVKELIPGVRKATQYVQGKTGAVANYLADAYDLGSDARVWINRGADVINAFNDATDLHNIFTWSPYTNINSLPKEKQEKVLKLIKSQSLGIEGVSNKQQSMMTDVYNHLVNRGLSPRNATAIMGSIMQESSFNPYAIQSGGDNAVGLIQMHGMRLKDYNKYLKENELKDNYISQLDYIIDLINGNRGDYYIEEHDRVLNSIKTLQDKKKRTKWEEKELQDSLAYYNKIYGDRAKTNRLYPISELTEALNNEDLSLDYISDLFTNTIERPGKPHYENRRAYAKAFLEHFYGLPQNN